MTSTTAVKSRPYPELGPLVRLHGLLLKDIPSVGSSPALLRSFVRDIVHEAAPFIDGVAPKDGSASRWRIRGTPRTYTSSAGTVQLHRYKIPKAQLRKIVYTGTKPTQSKSETWFSRRSIHQNKAQKCTASWADFKYAFQDYHSETEKAFNPGIIEATTSIIWPVSGLAFIESITGRDWLCESMKLIEMKHRIEPKPLWNRSFPTLQLVVSLVEGDEFLVVNIPIIYLEHTQESQTAKASNFVIGAYVSIERIRLLPNDGIEWIMATASDAKGVLPQWVQNMAVPRLIAHDVDMFMKWVNLERDKRKKSLNSVR